MQIRINYILQKNQREHVNNIISEAVNGTEEQKPHPEETEENRDYYEPAGMTNSEVSDEEIEKKKEEHEESLREREQEPSDYYVVRGARLTCTCGSHARRLDLDMDSGYFVKTLV